MKKNILLLLLAVVVSMFTYNCSHDSTNDLSTSEKIRIYLPENFENNMDIALESIIVGIKHNGTPDEQLEKSMMHFGSICNIEEDDVKEYLQTNKLKSGESNGINEIIDENISPQGKAYFNQLMNCFNQIDSYREISNEVDTFYFNSFQAYAISEIYSIESLIVNSTELSENEKTVLVSTSSTLKYFISDFDLLAGFVLENFGVGLKSATGLFSSIWKAVKKVVSAVVSVVVHVVATTVTSAVGGWGDMGQLAAPFCAVGGAIGGFIEGLSKGIECDSFDFDCIFDKEIMSVC